MFRKKGSCILIEKKGKANCRNEGGMLAGRMRMPLLNMGVTKQVSLLVLESTLDMISEKSN